MNKFKLFSILSLGFLFGMSFTSCEDTLADNVNPDKAHTNTADQGLPVCVFYAQQTVYDHSEYNVFLSQCLTTMSNAQVTGLPYRSGWEFLNINRHPQWRRHFYDIGVNVKEMIENAQSIGSPNYELIGRTIRLMSTQLTTDAFGDMPLTEVYMSNTPKYDSQASIYKWMFDEADELIRLYEDPAYINADGNREITKVQDRVYSGDLNKWKGLVYAVKARLLLRNIPNVDLNKCDEIIKCAKKAIEIWQSGDLLYGEFFGNEPRYNFDGGSTTQNCPWGEALPIINGWESRSNGLTSAVPSKFFIEDCMGVINPETDETKGLWNKTNGYGADPRLSLLLVPRTGPVTADSKDEAIMIRYLENNKGTGTTYKQANFPDLYAGAYAKNDGYNPIFTMEELYFIVAEAEYWKGNKATACQWAKEATKWNIQRHLDRFTKDNGGFYPYENNAKAKSAAINKRAVARFEATVEAFLNNNGTAKITGISGEVLPCEQIGNKHWFFNETNYKLSDLMIQKWIAMYMQPEQWTDMRRYHYSNKRNGYTIGTANEIVYPTLRRPYNLYSAYWVDGLTAAEQENTWIQRLNYDPQTEDIYNMNEVIRVGAYKNYKWLQKPMNWAQDPGVRTSLIAE